MQPNLKCVLLINDRFSNFINKITIDKAGCVDVVIRINSLQHAIDYLENSIKTPESYPLPELIFLRIENSDFTT